MKYCMRTILGRYRRKGFRLTSQCAENCKIKVRSILVCTLYSIKYGNKFGLSRIERKKFDYLYLVQRIGATLKQESGDVDVSGFGGVHQRRRLARVEAVDDVAAVRHEELDGGLKRWKNFFCR
jgi:hypothetical protein